MKIKRTVLGPVLVVGIAFLSGGWFLQRGVAQDRAVFQESQIFNEVLQRISRDYVDEHPPEELYRMAVEGVLRELGDPHTTFMSAEEYADLRLQTTGEYGGLGIQIAERNGWITVIAPLPGTPAERAGLLAGDRIVAVEGESTEGWTADDAVNVLRGPKGEPVTIQVARLGVDEPIRYRLVRDEIHFESVRSSFMLEDGIGYARLGVFAATSTDELQDAIHELREQGARGLILDLRTNPGGLLDQGVSVSDLFLEKGQGIVETRGRDPRVNEVFRAEHGQEFPDLPVVVLVDEYSASASEIVAGALQDHDRALVVGTTSFGKGSVQSLFPLSGGNFLKMTTGKWYTPSGRSIQKDRQRTGDPVELVGDEPISEDGEPVPAAESVDTAGREEYRTDSGRTVYGGGGIVPDLIVRPDTLTTAEQAFFQAASKSGNTYSNVLYKYAIEYVREHPNLEPSFGVTSAMAREFFQRLQEAGAEVTREQFEGAERLVSQRIGYEIALAKFGQAAAEQRSSADDNVVRAAAELLRKAPNQAMLFELAESGASASR